MTAPEVLLVGRRNGARRACRALGLNCHVVDTQADCAPPQYKAVQAVVAVTEAAVVPAARLRQALCPGGVDVQTAERCTDKLLMKASVAAAGLPCARFTGVHGRLDAAALTAKLGLPIVLKTRTGSGSRDAVVANTIDDLPTHVSQPAIAESFVTGTEMSFESLVVDGAPVWTNPTQYVEPRWANLLPAALDPDIAAAVSTLNRKVIAALGIDRGMTHMEVFLTDGGPVFGELAVRPPGGHIMQLIELAYGFDPWAAMLQVELGHTPPIARQAACCAGMRFIHPGAGVIRRVSGLDEVRDLATLEILSCRLQPGDAVAARRSTGQHHGFAILAGRHDAVRADLDIMRKALRIEMEPDPGS